jgi:hypothetical protein
MKPLFRIPILGLLAVCAVMLGQLAFISLVRAAPAVPLAAHIAPRPICAP